MDGRTWSVVKFIEENTVEAVPSTWILGSSCYWPPYPREKLVAAIKNFESPNTHWPLYKMEVFRNGTFGTYLEARRKLNVAEYMSDLNQEDEPQTRKLRHRRHVDSSSDDETASQKEKSLPKPPSKPHNSSSVEDNNCVPVYRNSAATTVTVENCCCCPFHERIVKVSVDEIKNIKKQYVFLTNILADMKTEISDIKSMLSAKEQPTKDESFLSKFPFPINDEITLEAVENYLNTSDNFEKTVPELANLGGNSVYDFVKRVLTVLLTNKFAAKYSFLGRKQKSCFNALKLSGLVLRAVEYSKKGDQKEGEDAISKWLRRANERK